MAKCLLGLFVLGLIACGPPQPKEPTKEGQARAKAKAEARAAQQQQKKPPQKVAVPKYEIFDDSVDSTGMRLVFVGTADGFSPAQQRLIVADILEPEKGKNRWVRVFVRPNSARLQVGRGDCLESLNAGAILPCDYSR